jgi:hypothetical protein
VKRTVAEALEKEDYQQAFEVALESTHYSVVEWLCAQVAPEKVLGLTPMPLDQAVVVSLLQQLGMNLHEVRMHCSNHMYSMNMPNQFVSLPHTNLRRLVIAVLSSFEDAVPSALECAACSQAATDCFLSRSYVRSQGQ